MEKKDDVKEVEMQRVHQPKNLAEISAALHFVEELLRTGKDPLGCVKTH